MSSPNSERREKPQAVAGEREWTIREVAAKTAVTVHTLRYYERIGLLAGVPRSASGHRRYGEAEVQWVLFLRKIHQTGMPIRRMLEYARLLRRGNSTVRERRLLLEAHREEVEQRLGELQANLDLLKYKIAKYEELEREAAETVHFEPRPKAAIGG